MTTQIIPTQQTTMILWYKNVNSTYKGNVQYTQYKAMSTYTNLTKTINNEMVGISVQSSCCGFVIFKSFKTTYPQQMHIGLHLVIIMCSIGQLLIVGTISLSIMKGTNEVTATMSFSSIFIYKRLGQ